MNATLFIAVALFSQACINFGSFSRLIFLLYCAETDKSALMVLPKESRDEINKYRGFETLVMEQSQFTFYKANRIDKVVFSTFAELKSYLLEEKKSVKRVVCYNTCIREKGLHQVLELLSFSLFTYFFDTDRIKSHGTRNLLFSPKTMLPHRVCIYPDLANHIDLEFAGNRYREIKVDCPRLACWLYQESSSPKSLAIRFLSKVNISRLIHVVLQKHFDSVGKHRFFAIVLETDGQLDEGFSDSLDGGDDAVIKYGLRSAFSEEEISLFRECNEFKLVAMSHEVQITSGEEEVEKQAVPNNNKRKVMNV
uniref:Serpin domain-containing protein n=1 Tax=Ditylenchus dipsaci TaxID=166011 RepID=A0A915D1R1_9BILA